MKAAKNNYGDHTATKKAEPVANCDLKRRTKIGRKQSAKDSAEFSIFTFHLYK